MEDILVILEETPWWVYALFAYLVIMGLQAAKPRTVSIQRLVILPVILTVWGLIGMAWTLPTILAWGVSLILGVGIGWLSVRTWKIRYDRKKRELHLPGTYTTLSLALLFFSMKYFFGYYEATHPTIPPEIVLSQTAVSGLIAGVFIGRLLFYWKRFEEA